MQNLKMKREIMMAHLVIFGSIDQMEHTCDYHGWLPQQLAVHQTRKLNETDFKSKHAHIPHRMERQLNSRRATI
ncbi:hypothetical protein WN944_020393 [Citrus x changshan-huyou]|uniref:Uncharacterized protein n=1 Tax=Citrus x changshan-huyou TaxID=2935761 RepID=A0AAP0QGS5_9ROSI